MPEDQPIRILIADDHKIIRESLTMLLKRLKMDVVGAAQNGQEAVDLYRQHHPDITLMDLQMPLMDGLTATRTILAEFPAARIIVLTGSADQAENSRQAGAKALVLKDAPTQELIDAIRAVHSMPNEVN